MFPMETGGHVVSFFGFPVMGLLLPIVTIVCALLYFAGRYEKRANFKTGAILLSVPAVLAVVEVGFFLSVFGAR